MKIKLVFATIIILGVLTSVQAKSTENINDTSSTLESIDSVDALVSRKCEHGKYTYECDECRYEIGFVKANDNLFKQKLMNVTKSLTGQSEVVVNLTGEIRFDELKSIQISSLSDGIIKNNFVTLGQKVVKGQPLLEIESVSVGDDQAMYAESKGLLDFAKRNYDRVDRLYKEKIASEKAYFQAKQEYEAARIRFTSIQSKLDRLGSSVKANGKIVLRSPLDGTVLSIRAVPGEKASLGDVLVTVGDDLDMVMWADVYEYDIQAVKNALASEGRLTAAISVKAYPGEEFAGALEILNPSLNESTRTLKARIRVQNKDSRLLAGMFAIVKVSIPQSGDAIIIPRASVLQDEGQSFVFVHYKDDYYVRRNVVTGQVFTDKVEIKKGIEPGSMVVAQGAFLMKSDILRSKMGAGCAD